LDKKSAIAKALIISTKFLNNMMTSKRNSQHQYDNKGKAAIFRSKCRWEEEGEKATKYIFFLFRKKRLRGLDADVFFQL